MYLQPNIDIVAITLREWFKDAVGSNIGYRTARAVTGCALCLYGLCFRAANSVILELGSRHGRYHRKLSTRPESLVFCLHTSIRTG